MRSTPNTIITHHRLARFITWAGLWLVWLAGAFLTLDSAQRRRALDRAARIATNLIIAQAVMRYRAPQRAAHRHGKLKHRGRRRAVCGVRLRRALRGGDVFARLHAILCVMRDAQAHVTALLRRLRRGLTRLRTIAPQRARLLHIASFICAPHAAADTS